MREGRELVEVITDALSACPYRANIGFAGEFQVVDGSELVSRCLVSVDRGNVEKQGGAETNLWVTYEKAVDGLRVSHVDGDVTAVFCYCLLELSPGWPDAEALLRQMTLK